MNWLKNILMYLSPILLTCCFIFCSTNKALGQKKERTRLKLYYEKLPNNDKKISLVLTMGSGKKIAGVPYSEIRLTSYDLGDQIDLATLSTDSIGEAALFINSNFPLSKDEDGYFVVKARYAGNDSLKAARKTISISDLNVEIQFEIVDSVKVLTVSTYQTDSLGDKMPVGEIDLDIGVERLYSILYLDEVETDDEGIGTIEFPNDIPGDSIGQINVVARIGEHDDYGTITKSKKINWGTKVDYSHKSNGRSLFGEEAPLWMIISVFVVLAGAWYNFMLAIYKIFQMKKIDPN